MTPTKKPAPWQTIVLILAVIAMGIALRVRAATHQKLMAKIASQQETIDRYLADAARASRALEECRAGSPRDDP